MRYEIEDEIAAHERRNASLRNVLLSKKVNFYEPRIIESHFWAWSKDDAFGLSDELKKHGFAILVCRHSASREDPNLWNVEVAVTQSVESTLSTEFTERLVRLAHSFRARYDGWGTSI